MFTFDFLDPFRVGTVSRPRALQRLTSRADGDAVTTV
jgi:hypothetical protein